MSHKQYNIDKAKKTLEENLESDDYGLIVSKDGELKGIWIPDSAEDKDIFPQGIAQLCITHFGLDPNAWIKSSLISTGCEVTNLILFRS